MTTNKKSDTEEAKTIIHIFKSLHEENSKRHWGYCYLEHLNPSNDEEKYDKHFAIFRDTLTSFLESKYSIEELSKMNSFILFYDDKKRNQDERLNLKDYLEIMKSSKSFFEYLLKLWRLAKKKFCCVKFDPEEIDNFCSDYFYINFKYNSYLIDIKEIEPKEYWYPHKNEKERFWEIDKLWSEYKDRDVVRKSREFLTYYLESTRGKTFNKDKKTKKREIEDALRDLITTFKIEGLYDDLNLILDKFREIRNKLKTEAPEGKEQEKFVENFEKSPHKSISTRLLIDLLKALHNALIVMEKMSKENLIDNA